MSKFPIDVKVPNTEDKNLDKALTDVQTILSSARKVLYTNPNTNQIDPTILNYITLWQEPAQTNLAILKNYVKGLEDAADQKINTEFNKFINNHNDVLFNVILPRIELLNELYKYINIADRKLGESEEVSAIGRINSIIDKTRPLIERWLSVQKDIESRLKYEKGLSQQSGGSDGEWVATHIDPFTNVGRGKKKVKLDGFSLEAQEEIKRYSHDKGNKYKMDLHETSKDLYKEEMPSKSLSHYKVQTSARGSKEAPFGGKRRVAKRRIVKK